MFLGGLFAAIRRRLFFNIIDGASSFLPFIYIEHVFKITSEVTKIFYLQIIKF